MKLRFSIHYRAEWGQNLLVALSYSSADGACRTAAVPMTTQDGDYWQAETSIVASRRSPVTSFTYVYKVVDGDGKELRREWDLVARRYCFDPSKTYLLNDQWRDRPLPFHLYTNAYAVTRHLSVAVPADPVRMPLYRKTIMFRISAPQLLAGQQVGLLGSHPSLGAWNPARYLLMDDVGQREWMLTLNADVLDDGVEYKYVVVDEATHQLLAWEEGDNRVITEMPGEGEILVTFGEHLRLAEKTWRAAGVSVPVFALRSEHSFGVGDFGDLYRFIEWAEVAGLRIIQLLPVGDTTSTRQWADSDPYHPVSAFALHPHYMDLEQLGSLSDSQLMTDYHRRQHELNALDYSDYEAVDVVKSEYLQAFFMEQGRLTLDSADYQQWYEANKEWLDPYAAWHARHATRPAEPDLTCFTQYHLHLQLKRAADYARSKGILLKGDLPVGMSACGAETALHPSFFHLDSCMGTPPDAFSLQGQNWGIPTYDWEDEDLTAWFHQRLQHMEQYFDALRVDNMLAYFRVWEIPAEQLFGIMGHFAPAIPYTPTEIEQFGLPFRRDFLTRPFINDRTIERYFGIHAQYVRDNFLEQKAYGLYELKEEVATQRSVQQFFEGRTDENSLWIRDGLYQLVANVLLLEDPYRPETYHPRVLAYRESVFEALSADERDAFLRLYNNYYSQRHSSFWSERGYRLLSELFSKTRMLLCADDHGIMPPCVGPVLDGLRILTLEIQQMPKLPGQEFTHLDGNPVRSVATIATHDMAPLRLWWQENPDRAQRFFNTMLQKQGNAPEQLSTQLAEEIIARHLYSPSMLCILQLQDWMAMDTELRTKQLRQERINVPGNPSNRWQWRMHVTIEQLLASEKFNEKINTMVTRSKRGV